MRQTGSSQIKSPLLEYAVSRLSPAVFSHPVWVRFGKKNGTLALKLADDLLSAAKKLQNEDPGTACQILLICAVYQNSAGDCFNALKTTRQALALAQRASLHKETIWAIWGVCAISIQQENYEQAATNFVDLQAALSAQNEWILSDFVDVLRQSFFKPETVARERPADSPNNSSFDNVLSFTIEWLQNWGLSSLEFEPDFEITPVTVTSQAIRRSILTQSFFSFQRWQGRWHTLMLAIRGELKLQWTENTSQIGKRRFSFWASLMSFLSLHRSNRNSEAPVVSEIAQAHDTPLLPRVEEISHLKAKTPRKKPVSKIEKAHGSQRAGQATTTVPVAVHMLGAFSMTIGDLTVKLSASRGLSLLKYLLLHHNKQKVLREVLMDVFWPDAEPEIARNNLNVAIHSLRKALREIIFLPVIIFEDGAYGLESNLRVWLDVEEFENCVKAGQRLEERNQLTAAVTEYESAISLYQGDFLEENPYEEWTVLTRERLRMAYLDVLDRLSQIYFNQERYAACIAVCQLILTRDPCREDAHCLLMRCYGRQEQYPLALRQYQICVEALRAELDVEPAMKTRQLYERIRRREPL